MTEDKKESFIMRGEKYRRDCDQRAEQSLVDALATLKAEKPNDRSEKDRYYQITITDLEKVVALFTHYVVNEGVEKREND